jgi:3-methyl-2-oxobutanoate hydroxymethyltransferase
MHTLRNLYKKGEPIAMITAHDFPSARAADESGMDMVLVGDSLGMVAMGLENTTEVVMEEMLLHCRSVARGAKHAFIVSGPSAYLLRVWIRRLMNKHTGWRSTHGLI